jgi:hypothetical protein
MMFNTLPMQMQNRGGFAVDPDRWRQAAAVLNPPGAAGAGGFQLPGPISGIAGGTWNMDGTQATPSQQVLPPDTQSIDVLKQANPALPSAPMQTGLFGQGSPTARQATPAQAVTAPNSMSQGVATMLGQAPQTPQGGYWQGGGKFRLKDGLAAALAVFGDALSGDGRNAATAALGQNRANGLAGRQKAEADYQRAQQIASLPGMNEREFAAYLENPDQWAANMSDAISSHHAAVNVNQSDTRVYGDPAQGGHIYRPNRVIENGPDVYEYDPMAGETSPVLQGLTSGEQYARSLGLAPGSPGWADAVRDAELGGNGPTAFGYDQQLEGFKQGNRLTMEEQRQANRLQQRSTPTYRDANPPPARTAARGGSAPRRAVARPTATGPGGQKIEWNGTAWVPAR